MKFRAIIFITVILCLANASSAQVPRPGILPTLRPAVKDDGTDDFIVGDVKGSVKTNAVFIPKPVYPAEARVVGAEGTVRVRITVDKEGNVTTAAAESGEPLLRGASEDVARRSKFRIARDAAGQPVEADGILMYTFEIKPAGWIKIGSGISSIQRFPVSNISIPMIRKAFDPQWANELRLLEKLEEIRRAEPAAATRPTLVRGPVVNSGVGGSLSGRGSASQSVSGTLILPPRPTVEQVTISQELVAALREKVSKDAVRSWQFEFGVSLFAAFDQFRDPGQRRAAADTVLRFIQSKPDGVSDEVLTAMRTLESKFRDGKRSMEAEDAISNAMRVIMKSR